MTEAAVPRCTSIPREYGKRYLSRLMQYHSGAANVKANSLKIKIFEFDMELASLMYTLRFILIDFGNCCPH